MDKINWRSKCINYRESNDWRIRW